MTRTVKSILACCAAAISAGAAIGWSLGNPSKAVSVVVQQLPEGAIQPQAAVDSKGIVHILYFKGKPEAGDLYYYHYPANQGVSAASAPIRVNSQPGTAMATGTIRTEQIAIGQNDRVHVIWNGIGPKGANGYPELHAAYARLNDAGTAFEPQRNLCQWTGNLDGGDSITADRSGEVYAFWHTGPPGNKLAEGGRGVFLAVSHDNGATFDREKLINPEPTGACGCCSIRAFTDRKGVIHVLYRAARNRGAERDTILMTSTDKGQTFALRYLDPWQINGCPMSSFSLTDDDKSVYAAWETRDQVFWAPLDPQGRPAITPSVAPGAEKSKHPVILANGKGQVLFAWTEGTGWQRGGSLGWQVYDTSGQPLGSPGHLDGGVPVWSLLSAYARPDGSFVLLH